MTGETERARPGISPIFVDVLRVVGAVLGSIALLLVVEVATLASTGAFAPDTNPDLWLSLVFDGDLWWFVLVVYLVVWVVAVCGALLAHVLLRRAKRDPASRAVIAAIWFALLVATLLAAATMYWLAFRMTTLAG
jgi:Kef-type K+ transport system membrane component KefB